MTLRLIIKPGDIEWAREAAATAAYLFPNFNMEGIEYSELSNRRIPFGDDRDLEDVVVCREWLKHFKQTLGVSRSHTSYGCKHAAENWAGRYVPNSALIAAAAGLGITQKPAGGPNTYLALSYSSWPKGWCNFREEKFIDSVEVTTS